MAITKPLKPASLGKKIVDIVSSTLVDEYSAFYIYRNAYNALQNLGHVKAAKFFLKESETELGHALIIENYLTDWNIVPTLPIVPADVLTFQFTDLVSVINKAYSIELALLQKYDKSSDDLLESDKVSFDFLQQFRQIQKESVAEYSMLLTQLALITDLSDPLAMITFEKRYF